MKRIEIHIKDGEFYISVLPDGAEVILLDFDEKERIRYFTHGLDIIEEEMSFPNVIEGET